MKLINDWKIVLLLCTSLGLAPFFPEPHLVGKIRWMLGGAHGMSITDWFDVLLHGFPWILCIRLLVLKAISLTKK